MTQPYERRPLSLGRMLGLGMVPTGLEREAMEVLSIRNPLVRIFKIWQFKRKMLKEALSRFRFGKPMPQREPLSRIGTIRLRIESICNSLRADMEKMEE